MFRPALVRLWVIVAAVTALLPVTYAQVGDGQTGPARSYEGTLNVVWGDPRRGSGTAGEIHYSLALADGTVVPLQFTAREDAALTYFGKPVVVTGRLAARPASDTGPPGGNVIVVDAIGPAQPAAQGAAGDDPPAAPIIGTKRVLFLLLKFADDTAVPHPASFFHNLTNRDTGSPGIPATINGFFKKTSNNRFSWIGDIGGMGGIGGSTWIPLPQPKSYYADCGFDATCLNFERINTDSVAAGKAQGINFGSYDTINFVYSNDLDCCAWGGGMTIDGKFFGVTWEPPWAQETDVYSHELGHSLGLPHSGWVYYAYDSSWDVMSADQTVNPTFCGSYVSRNGGSGTLTCTEPGGGYITAHRDYLGWIPSANIVQTNTVTNVNVTLEGASLPMGATPKMIKICLTGLPCSGNSARYFTVEARVRSGGSNTQFDNGIPGEGVIIHDVQMNRPAVFGECFFNNQSGWAMPVDATPGDYDSTSCLPVGSYPNFALHNAQFRTGQTYTNTTFGFRVSVVSRSGSTFQVSVQTMMTTEMWLDGPANGSTVGRPFTVQGWAINRLAASGTGVDTVHVYAAPAGGGAATFLGVAAYGGARPDVGAIFGGQFTNSGFTLTAGASLAPGSYTVTAYARNTVTGSFDTAKSANITIPAPVSNGFLNIDTPAPSSAVPSSFEVGGWALDAGAPAGTGVDGLQFYVFPDDGAAPGVFVGTGSYGETRTDVGAIFGSRFNNSGFHFTITGLGPGNFVLGAYAHSTVTGAYSIVKTLRFVVNADALMSIDLPAAEMTIATPAFGVAGWAIDRGNPALGGTGVDTLHVYAYRNPGSGEPAIFLGVAIIGIERSDVEAIYGDQYRFSGYGLTVDRAAIGLTPGVYNVVAFAHSSVTNSFNNLAIVRVTLQ